MPDDKKKYSVEILGAAYKRKNPGKFDHLSDSVVGEALIRKNPTYEQHVIREEPKKKELETISLEALEEDSGLEPWGGAEAEAEAEPSADITEQQKNGGGFKSWLKSIGNYLSPVKTAEDPQQIQAEAEPEYPVLTDQQITDLETRKEALTKETSKIPATTLPSTTGIPSSMQPYRQMFPAKSREAEEIDARIQAFSDEGKIVYDDMKEIIGEDNYAYFTDLEAKQATKEALMAKHGNINERAIDQIINYHDVAQKENTFFEKGYQHYSDMAVNELKVGGASNEEIKNETHQTAQDLIDEDLKEDVKDIFSVADEEIKRLNEEIREAVSKKRTEKDPKKLEALNELIRKNEGMLKARDLDPKGWLNYETGYRNKGEEASVYDKAVNSGVTGLKNTPAQQLENIVRKNYVIWQQLKNDRKQTIKRLQQWGKKAIGKEFFEAQTGDVFAKQQHDQAMSNIESLESRLDALSGSDEHLGELNRAKAAFEASARAYYLNQDPVKYKGTSFADFFKTFGKGYVEDIAGQRTAEKVFGATNTELQNALSRTAMVEGFKLNKEEQEALVTSGGEVWARQAGGIASIVTKFAALDFMGNLYGIGPALKGWASSIQAAKVAGKAYRLQRMLQFTAGALYEEMKFRTIGGDPGTGAAFYGITRALNKIPLFAKYRKLDTPWYKQIPAELANANLSMTTASNLTEAIHSVSESLLNSKDFNYEIDKRFGETFPLRARKIMSDLSVNWLFGIKNLLNKGVIKKQLTIQELEYLKSVFDKYTENSKTKGDKFDFSKEAKEIEGVINDIKGITDPMIIGKKLKTTLKEAIKVKDQAKMLASLNKIATFSQELGLKNEGETAQKIIDLYRNKEMTPEEFLKEGEKFVRGYQERTFEMFFSAETKAEEDAEREQNIKEREQAEKEKIKKIPEAVKPEEKQEEEKAEIKAEEDDVMGYGRDIYKKHPSYQKIGSEDQYAKYYTESVLNDKTPTEEGFKEFVKKVEVKETEVPIPQPKDTGITEKEFPKKTTFKTEEKPSARTETPGERKRKLDDDRRETELKKKIDDDIFGETERKKIFNYDNPLAEKTVGNDNYRIALGLNKPDGSGTYIVFKNGEKVGSFDSVDDAKKHVEKVTTTESKPDQEKPIEPEETPVPFKEYFQDLKKDKIKNYRNEELAKLDYILHVLRDYVFEDEVRADNMRKGIGKIFNRINEGLLTQAVKAKITNPGVVKTAKDGLEELVKRAIKEGKEVPEEVLKEFPDIDKVEKEPWEMTKDEYLSSKPNRLTVNGRGKPSPPEGEVSFYGRATLNSKDYSYIIDDTPKNREWIKAHKYTIARHQALQIDHSYHHKDFVKTALEEGKTVPEEVLKEFPDLGKPKAKPEKVDAIPTTPEAAQKLADKYNALKKSDKESRPGIDIRNTLTEAHIKHGINYKTISGKIVIQSSEPEIEPTGKTEIPQSRLDEIQGKVDNKDKLTAEEKKIWDTEQYAPEGYYYDYEGNLKPKAEPGLIKVTPLKKGEGHTFGTFVDEKGQVYKSVWSQGPLEQKGGEFIRNAEKTQRTDEYEILSELQDLKHIPKVGKLVTTDQGEMFEIETLNPVKEGSLTAKELFTIEDTFEEIQKRGIEYGDKESYMRRSNGELVVIDFSTASKQKKAEKNNLASSGYEDLMTKPELDLYNAIGSGLNKKRMVKHYSGVPGIKQGKPNTYLLTQRPPSIGTHPIEGMQGDPVESKLGDRTVWEITYDKPLTPEEVRKYEMVKQFSFPEMGMIFKVPFGKSVMYHVVDNVSQKKNEVTISTYYDGKRTDKTIGFKHFDKTYLQDERAEIVDPNKLKESVTGKVSKQPEAKKPKSKPRVKKAVGKPKLYGGEPAKKYKPITKKQETTLLKKAINKKSTLPILEYVLVKDGQIIATDLEITLRMKTDLENGLHRLVGDEWIKDSRISEDEWPGDPDMGKKIAKVKITGVREAFERVVTKTHNDPLRPVMSGVHVYSEGNNIVIEATNAHYLVKTTVEGKYPKFDVILPVKAVQMMLYNKTSDSFDFEVFENNVIISGENYEITTRNIEGKFPRVNAVIPETSDTHFSIPTTQLIDALKKLKPFGMKDFPMATFTPDFEKGIISLHTQNIDENLEKTIELPMEGNLDLIKTNMDDVNLLMPRMVGDSPVPGVFGLDINLLLNLAGDFTTDKITFSSTRGITDAFAFTRAFILSSEPIKHVKDIVLAKPEEPEVTEVEEPKPEPPKPKPEQVVFDQIDKQLKEDYPELGLTDMEIKTLQQSVSSKMGEGKDLKSIVDAEIKIMQEQLEKAAPGENKPVEPSAVSEKPVKTVKADSQAKAKGEVLTQNQANERVESWKKEAERIGKEEDHSNEVIISLYDYTGNWTKGYHLAGYTTIHFDIQHGKGWDEEGLNELLDSGDRRLNIGGDLMEGFPNDLILIKEALEKRGKTVVGVLAACPCTAFAGSGARWWEPVHDQEDFNEVMKRYGWWAAKHFKSVTDYNEFLVLTAEEYIGKFNPLFSAIENPVGRIQKRMDFPNPTLSFQPNNYGDPYTKKTMLWGDFNPDLPQANVDPVEGSKMQSKLGSKDKIERSSTPEGFAFSFFMANNTSKAESKPSADSDKTIKAEIESITGYEANKPAGRGDSFHLTNKKNRKGIAFKTKKAADKEVEGLRSRGLDAYHKFDGEYFDIWIKDKKISLESIPTNVPKPTTLKGLKSFLKSMVGKTIYFHAMRDWSEWEPGTIKTVQSVSFSTTTKDDKERWIEFPPVKTIEFTEEGFTFNKRKGRTEFQYRYFPPETEPKEAKPNPVSDLITKNKTSQQIHDALGQDEIDQWVKEQFNEHEKFLDILHNAANLGAAHIPEETPEHSKNMTYAHELRGTDFWQKPYKEHYHKPQGMTKDKWLAKIEDAIKKGIYVPVETLDMYNNMKGVGLSKPASDMLKVIEEYEQLKVGEGTKYSDWREPIKELEKAGLIELIHHSTFGGGASNSRTYALKGKVYKNEYIEFKRDDIPFNIAENAYRNFSFDSDGRARNIRNDYIKHMQEVSKELSAMVTNDSQREILKQELPKYQRGYISRTIAALNADSRTASTMITGPANFNADRNRKKMETAMKRWDELNQWVEKGQKVIANKLLGGRTEGEKAEEVWQNFKKVVDDKIATIKGIDDGTLYYNRAGFITSLKNTIVGAAQKAVDPKLAQRILDYIQQQEKVLGMKKPVFAAKNSIWDDVAKIQKERLREKTPEELKAETGIEVVAEFVGAKITNEREDERVRIYFDEKPGEALRQEMKSEGWRWSPKNSAWQRKNTVNGIRSAERLMKKHFPTETDKDKEALVKIAKDVGGFDNIGDAGQYVNYLLETTKMPAKSDLKASEYFLALREASGIIDARQSNISVAPENTSRRSVEETREYLLAQFEKTDGELKKLYGARIEILDSYGDFITRKILKDPEEDPAYEGELAEYLNKPGKVLAIGEEVGELKKTGISLLKSKEGSYRYVATKNYRIIASLQVMSKDGKTGAILNIITHPSFQRQGVATALYDQAKKDFKSLKHSEDLSEDAKKWIAGLEKTKPEKGSDWVESSMAKPGSPKDTGGLWEDQHLGEFAEESGLPRLRYPELVKLVRQLIGKYPIIRKMRLQQLGSFVRDRNNPEETAHIRLKRALFDLVKEITGDPVTDLLDEGKVDIAQLEKIISHEIGHLWDFLPDFSKDKEIRKGNILAHLSAAVEKYNESLLGRDPAHPETITPEEKEALEKEAQRQLDEEFNEGEEIEIIREVIRQIPIYDETGLTADDVAAIWRDVNARSKFPDLYGYIATLNAGQKRAIMVAALKGIVNDELAQRFARRQVGVREERTTIRETKRPQKPTKKQFRERLAELMAEEIKKRGLFEADKIRDELKELTTWWNPFNPHLQSSYTQYRYKPSELWAEAFSVLLNNPDALKAKAPHFYKAFFAWFDVRADAAKTLRAMWDLVSDGNEDVYESRAADQRKGMIAGLQKRIKAVNAKNKQELKRWDRILKAWFSENIPAYKKFDNKEIRDSNLTLNQEIRNGLEMVNFSGEKVGVMMADMENNVMQEVVKAGIDIWDFGRMLMFVRQINDRRDKPAPWGMQEEFSKEDLQKLYDRWTPEQREVADKASEYFHDYIFPIIIKGYREGQIFDKYSVEKKIIPNRKTYVAYGVVKHIPEDIMRVTPLIKKITGTHGEIEHPLFTTLAKVAAIIHLTDRQKGWLKLKDAFEDVYPGVITKRKKNFRGGMIFPKTRGNVIEYFLDHGVNTPYEMPKYISDIFSGSSLQTSKLGRAVDMAITPFKLFGKFFKPLVTTYNPGFFLYGNLLRDHQRTLQHILTILGSSGKISTAKLATLPFTEYSTAFFKSFIEGAKYLSNKKQISETMRAMIDNGALFAGFYDRVNFESGELLEPILKANGLLKKQKNLRDQASDIRVFKELLYMVKGIEFAGSVIEISSKITAWKIFEKYLGAEAAGFYTRNYAGTPNFKERATLTEIINAIFPFSNIILQSLRTSAELAFNARTAGTYWFVQFMRSFVPGLIQALAASSVTAIFGEKYAKAYSKIGEYDRFNYFCYVIGENDHGQPIYFRWQLDEEARLVYATTQWMMQVAIEQDPRGWNQLYKLGVGMTPSASPLAEIGLNWLRFGLNKNPTDAHYGNDIIGRAEHEFDVAWGSRKEGLPFMIKWTLSKSGFHPMVQAFWPDPYKRWNINNIPYNRVIKQAGQGEREYLEDAAVHSPDNKQRTLEKLWLKRRTQKVVSEHGKAGEPDDLGTRTKVSLEVQMDYLKEFGPLSGLPKQSVNRLVGTYQELGYYHRFTFPVEAVSYARSTEEKVAILREVRKRSSQEEFNDLVKYMLLRNIISKGLLNKVLIDQAQQKKIDDDHIKKLNKANDSIAAPKKVGKNYRL